MQIYIYISPAANGEEVWKNSVSTLRATRSKPLATLLLPKLLDRKKARKKERKKERL